MLIGRIEDIADAQKIYEVEIVGLYLKCIIQAIDGIIQPVDLQILIDTMDGILNQTIPFHLLLHASKDEIDFLLLFARRIVLSIDGVLIPRMFMP